MQKDGRGNLVSTKREIANGYRKVANWYESNPSKWLKHNFSDSYGKCCAVECWDRQNPTLNRAPMAENDVLGTRLMSFNDHKASSVKDIINGCRRIAAHLDHGGLV
jgi:hypothetical protein